MTVHNPMPFELKVSNVVGNGLQAVNGFSLTFISKLVGVESGKFLFCNILFHLLQSLLSEGVDYECYPTSLSLPAESGPFPVKVMGTPKSTGRLTIHG